MTNINTALCERLRALDTCPVCGAKRKEFVDNETRMAIAVFDCGVDVLAIAGSFVIAIGCKTNVADAFARIKAEEKAKLEQPLVERAR